jgi:hypothetical protein
VSFAHDSADREHHTGKPFVQWDDFEDRGDPSQRPSLAIRLADPE